MIVYLVPGKDTQEITHLENEKLLDFKSKNLSDINLACKSNSTFFTAGRK